VGRRPRQQASEDFRCVSATKANPLRPSWVFSDDDTGATAADYLALGHWDRPMRVGNSVVPADYSGSPALAGTVNLVCLTVAREVVLTRKRLLRELQPDLP
jgi:hypothetical protein